MTNRSRYVGVRCAVALSIFVALAPASFGQSATIPVTLALSSNSLAYGGLRIAEQLGLFAKNGLEPRIVVLDSGSAATAALIGGSAQFAGAGPAEVLAARAKGLDVKIVTNVYRGFAAPITLSTAAMEKLSVKPGADLTDRFRALDGMTIAVPSATSALLAPVKAAAEQAGAKPRFVYMAQPTMAAALEAGAIQGFVGSSPFWVASILKKTGTIWIDAPRGELPVDFRPASSAVLQSSGSFAADNPETIKRIKAVFEQVAALIKSQPDVAFAALAKAYPQVDTQTLKVAFAEDADNWSSPQFSTDDVKQEKVLLARSVDLPGLKELDPVAVLLQAAH